MKAAVAPQPLVSPLNGLRSLSRADVELWNWFNHVFGPNEAWHARINDVIAPLLERRAGNEIVLHRTSAVPGPEHDKTYRFNSDEISFGRDPGNDVLLTPRSIGGKHARIVREGSGYLLEDLGSPLGIYLNKRKMRPNEKAAITRRDEVSIFPYRFMFDVETRWVPETEIETRAFPPESCEWLQFTRNRPLDSTGFLISAHPADQVAYFETSRVFLEQLLDRFLKPLGISEITSRSFAAQSGVIDFLILATIARFNNSVALPFSWSVCSTTGETVYAANEPGLHIRYAIGVSQLTGSFRVFLPHALLRQMARTFTGAPRRHEIPARWSFPIVLGSEEFTAAEIRNIEVGDVILFERAPRMFIAGDGQRGWTLSAIDDNVSQFRIDNYFERADMSEINAIEATGPTRLDLDDLPVRLDVVVGEKEFSFREIQNLAEGSILELNRSKEEMVRVKLNGRFAADGELIEIDGRLGVRIVTWRQAS